MSSNPDLLVFVRSLLRDVLGEGLAYDRVCALQLKQAPQTFHSAIIQTTGDVLRRLSWYCYLVDGQLQPQLPLTETVIDAIAKAALGYPLNETAKQRQTEHQQLVVNGEPQAVLREQGCPAWLDALGDAELGPSWPKERATLAQQPTRYIRVNTLKTTREQLAHSLTQAGWQCQTVAEVPTALALKGDGALFKTQAFADGWFEQQDAGSQWLALQIPIKPGQRVIDACAGAGGKSLLLAAMQQGRGKVLSMDIEAWKLETLQQRAKRAGAGNIETRLIQSSKTIKRLADSADVLLLDVPCSGTGVYRRNPDGKWQHSAAHLQELHQVQRDILQRYSKMVRPHGYLAYATCSILPSENQQQVSHFLQQRPEFKLVRQQQILPSDSGWDGFYLAILQRDAGNEPKNTTVAE